MKAFGIWVLLFVFGTATICITLTSIPEASMKLHKSRKLKEYMNGDGYEGKGSNIDLQDYRPINPVPSSKASIRHGTIQHGTPLMPYIPDPTAPPPRPDHGKHNDVAFP